MEYHPKCHTELDYVEQFKTREYYVRTIPASTALTQSHSQQLWLWVSLFSFFCQGHVGKGSQTGNERV